MKICDIVTRFLSMGFTQSPTGQTLNQVSGKHTVYSESFSSGLKITLTPEIATLLNEHPIQGITKSISNKQEAQTFDYAMTLHTQQKSLDWGEGPGQWIGSEIRQAWLDKHLKDL